MGAFCPARPPISRGWVWKQPHSVKLHNDAGEACVEQTQRIWALPPNLPRAVCRLLALRTGRGARRLLLCAAKVGRARSATHAADGLKCSTPLIGSVGLWLRVFIEWRSRWIAGFGAGYDVMRLNGGTVFADKHVLCTRFIASHRSVIEVCFRPIPQEFCVCFWSRNFHCLCNLKAHPSVCVRPPVEYSCCSVDSSSHSEIRHGLLWLNAVFF